jgi:quinolinate synthase
MTVATEGILDRIAAAKEKLAGDLLILGHHYQRDEIIRFADYTGDSFKLARDAAAQADVKQIVFCGVHFMAESADILTSDEQVVILPDLKAGCSMADMADLDQVLDCWDEIEERTGGTTIPVTYMNSSARIKAFCGDHGGIVCTSSNARSVYRWAYERGERILFLPDEHLGRNTGHQMGIEDDQMTVWDPRLEDGGCPGDTLDRAKVILWRGFCSVHMSFLPEHARQLREKFPGIQIIAHPECTAEVVAESDHVGSTEGIIKAITASEPGSKWAVGTEHHLVNRLAAKLPDRMIVPLSPFACNCATMYQIDPPNLLEVLEGLVDGRVINRITVPEDVAKSALVALERMLANA